MVTENESLKYPGETNTFLTAIESNPPSTQLGTTSTIDLSQTEQFECPHWQGANFGIAVHIVKNTDFQVTTTQIDQSITRLNNAFADLNITFTKLSQRTIEETTLGDDFDGGSDAQKTILSGYCTDNVINYFIGDLSSGMNGRATFPFKQKDWVIVNYKRLHTSTLIHEIGHYFGLHHTYSGVESDAASATSLTVAKAEGTDGWKYGDFLIDTPLDPRSRASYDITNCTYSGNKVDHDGATFHPDGLNFMGKGHSECRSRFSAGQKYRMLEYIRRYKYYLIRGDQASDYDISSDNPVRYFPHTDDFDRTDAFREHIWLQEHDDSDNTNWRNAPYTDSDNTGASSAQSGQTFMYFEASLDYTDKDNAILLSPFYDLRKRTDANVEFHYHMYGRNTGSLKLEVTTDKGKTWASLFSVTGQQQSSGSAAWKSKKVDLSAYLNQVIQLRLVATGTGRSKSDISIDNVTVTASPSLLVEPGETITDVDGNTYRTVTIDDQTWMAENLRTTTCNDGTTKLATFKIADSKTPVKLNEAPGLVWHNDDENSTRSTKYGPLYTWEAVSNASCEVCPQGWRTPTYQEWQKLVRTWYYTLNEDGELVQPDEPSNGAGLAYAGRQLRAKDDAWPYSETNTNSSGFSALPGGWLWNGRFSYLGSRSAWWAPDNGNPRCAKIARGDHGTWMSAASSGDVLYIRCIKK